MNKQTKILLMFLVSAVFCTGLLHAEERDREGAFAGVFLKRAEHPVGEREYLALVIKPFESDDHVTILVPRNEDFMHAASALHEGDKVEIGFVREEGQKWLRAYRFIASTSPIGRTLTRELRMLEGLILTEAAGNSRRKLPFKESKTGSGGST